MPNKSVNIVAQQFIKNTADRTDSVSKQQLIEQQFIEISFIEPTVYRIPLLNICFLNAHMQWIKFYQ